MAERVAFTGRVVGQEEAAKQAIEDFKMAAEEYKKQLSDVGITGKTVTVMEGGYLFGDRYGRGADILYSYLGFTAPQKLQAAFDNGDFYLEVSMEVLHEYCGDYIVRAVWDGAEDLSDNNVWNSIPAVKAGNVIEIDFSNYFSRDIYTSSKQMKHLVEELLALGS